jgi:SAM-dependent methyltransferase
MTGFELLYRCLLPFEHPLYRMVNAVLREKARCFPFRPRLLDVGGRSSNYTVGIAADVVVTELPRTSAVQQKLALGATDELIRKIRSRRSNIVDYTFDDLTRTSLDRSSFDLAAAVEVIEHVEDDDIFVANLRSVLKDGGCAVLTTPNGDVVRNNNPDHVRHYKKEEMSELLRRHFRQVDVSYAVMQDEDLRRGMHRWSVRQPVRTLGSFYGNWRNARTHRPQDIAGTSEGTLHLFAVVTC